MSPLIEPPSEADPTTQAAEPMTAEVGGGNNSAFAAMNPYLDRWLEAVASDTSLPSEAHGVANVMARSVGIGCVAFTDWHRINAALGRHRRDRAVFEILSELELEGYLGPKVGDDRFGRSYGLSLLIPEREL